MALKCLDVVGIDGVFVIHFCSSSVFCVMVVGCYGGFLLFCGFSSFKILKSQTNSFFHLLK